MDDRRIGLIVRALRRRRGWRQVDLAAAAHTSQASISIFERGHLDGFAFATIRRVLAALEVRGGLDVQWRGGGLDQTIDERHARLVGAVIEALRGRGWETVVEVTYAVFGERGPIEVLAFHAATGSLLVIEVKTELTSVEETLRRLDQKVRLAPRIGREQFGWLATTSSRLLVLPETSTTRGQVARHARVFDAVLPQANLGVRRWLLRPFGVLRGRWFFRDKSPRSVKERAGGPDRVRRQQPGIREQRRRAKSGSGSLETVQTGR